MSHSPSGRYNPNRSPNMQNIPIRTLEGRAIKAALLSKLYGCDHDWQKLVDDEGNLVEPAQDICVNCGEKR